MTNQEIKTFADFATPGIYLRTLQRVPYEPPCYEKALESIEAFGRRIFPEFRIDDHNRFVFLNLCRWLYADPEMEAHNPFSPPGKVIKIAGDLNKGIYIAGATGSGKSVAVEIINALAKWEGIAFRVDGELIPLKWKAFLASDIHEEVSRDNSKLREFKDKPVLCIQDLGAESGEDAVYMGNRIKPLRTIIEARGEHQDQMTIITSNHAPTSEVMRKRLTDRGVSRIIGMTNYFVLGGKDRRTSRFK